MNSVNLLTFGTFGISVLLGIMALVIQDLRKQRPDARIQIRVRTTFATTSLALRDAGRTSDLFAVIRSDNLFSRWFGPKTTRLRTVAGPSGLRIVIGAAVFVELASLLMTKVLPLPPLAKPILLIVLPVLTAVQAYRFLVERFKRRFLEGFPDVIDLIVRAVRAGVPVAQIMSVASEECGEPLRSEFKLMGDGLKVGLDLEEVLDTAVIRIGIPDFSFFCVCLLLQRETGGQLSETLENLAGIVRRRREIRQKTKALTSEARMTTKIIAVIPFFVVGMMYMLNRSYMMVLFNTLAGQKLLTYAGFSLAIGLTIVHKMSKLDTAR